MAEELVRSWAEQKFFDDLDKAKEGLASIVLEIANANAAAKKSEGFAAQAATIKDVVTIQHALVDANGKLVNNYNALNGKYKEAIALMAVQNGHSKETVQVQREIIKLKGDEAREAARAAKAEKDYASVTLNSVNAYREAIKTLTKERNSLNLLTAQGAVRQKELNAEIDHYNKLIKNSVDGQEKQRLNIGNYASAFNGLGQSVAQVAREMPAFVNSFSTGIMAISNNLPMLIDQIDMIKQANKTAKAEAMNQAAAAGASAKATALAGGASEKAAEEIGELAKQQALAAAEGIKGKGVFKQLVGAIFNWQTALIVGITIVAAYSKEIKQFFDELFNGKSALDATKLSVEQLNKAYESPELAQAVTNVNELRINIQLAKEGLLDKQKVLHQYNETLGKTTGEVGSLDAAEQALIKNGDAYIKMTLYKAAAQIAFQDAAKKAIELEKSRAESEFATISTIEKFASVVAGGGIDPKVLQKRKAEKEKALEQELKAQEDIAVKFQKRTADIAKKFNFDIFGGTQDEKVKKVKDTSKADARARQKALDEETERTLKATKGMYEKRLAIAKDAVQNEKLSLQERLTNIDKALLDEVSIVQLNGAIQHKTREEIEADITEMVLKYNKLRTEIVDRETKEQAKREQDNLKSITGNGKTQSRKEFEEEQKERFNTLNTYTQAGIESAQLTASINSSITARRIQEIDNEIEAIQKRTDAEIKAIEKSGLSAIEKERAIAEAKGRSESKIKQLEDDRRKRATRAAQFEKAVTISQIIASTALAIVKQLAATPLPAGAGFVAAIAAAGALQLGAAIAAPIPQYEEGTKGKPHPGGPAVMFEGDKPELVIENGKAWMGKKEGIYNLSRGAEVISNKELMEISRHYALGMPKLIPQQAGMDTRGIEKGLAEVKSAIANKKETIVNFHGLGIQHLVKSGSSVQNRLHNLKH